MRLGIDIGGTKADAVAIDEGLNVLGRLRLPTEKGADGVLATAVAVVERLAAELDTTPAAIESIGVGVPGVVDPRTGRVEHAVNLELAALDLGPELSRRLGPSVRVENDVNAAALGAYHLLRLTGSAAYLNLGTGLAAGLVLDGQLEGELWRGARGTAGEIGHIPVDPNGWPCPCGQRGCLETVASGSGIARHWHSDAALPLVDLFDRADAGEPDAVSVRRGLIEGAAAAVRLLVLTIDVDTVVVGGGISNLGDRLFVPLRATLDDWAVASPFLASLELSERVQRAPLERPIAAIGAALVGIKE